MDLRGPEWIRSIYKMAHTAIQYVPEKGYEIDYNKIPENFLPPSALEEMCITWKFIKERPPIYHVGKEFLQAIGKIDRDIPVDLLPEKFFAYFSFAGKSLWDGSDWVQGMYVYIGPPEDSALRPAHWPTTKKVFWAVGITESDKEGISKCSRILVDVTEQKFADMISGLKTDEGSLEYDANFFRVGINLVLYVNSVGCDLLEAPPVKRLKPADKKRRVFSGEPLNMCQLPVVLVSWNYQKPKQYHVGETWVDPFMRWQRCGKEFSQVRLTWVVGHERHYKNTQP